LKRYLANISLFNYENPFQMIKHIFENLKILILFRNKLPLHFYILKVSYYRSDNNGYACQNYHINLIPVILDYYQLNLIIK
jgi:hypothetical protein